VSEETPKDGGGGGEAGPEWNRLIELSAKYPEIGAPLAALAFKIGDDDVGNRLV
jgi:hypothetical protein